MLIEIGKDDIVEMKNVHTSSQRDSMIITNVLSFTGPITIFNNKIELGYNEVVILEDNESAMNLFKRIHSELS